MWESIYEISVPVAHSYCLIISSHPSAEMELYPERAEQTDVSAMPLCHLKCPRHTLEVAKPIPRGMFLLFQHLSHAPATCIAVEFIFVS